MKNNKTKIFSENFIGKGIDTSEYPILSNAIFEYFPPDGLYRLSNKYGEDFDYSYNKDGILNNRFYPIMLFEFLAVVKVGGQIILHFTKNFEKNRINNILKEINKMYRHTAKLIKNQINNGEQIIIYEKFKSVYQKNDSIDKWSFGIITGGNSEEYISKIINDIKLQNIPNYEIIICGKYVGNKENVIHIPFDKYEHLRWITKKKNLICEKAKYNNILILHDHTSIEKHWYEGFKKFGNYFDAVHISAINGNTWKKEITWTSWKKPYTSWLHKHWFLRTYFDLNAHSEMDQRDWSSTVGIVGYGVIIKKHIWKEIKFNEDLFWDQGEDYDLNERLFENSFIIRLNPYSFFVNLKSRWENMKYPYLDAKNNFYSKKIRISLIKTSKKYLFFIYELLIKPFFKNPILTIKNKCKKTINNLKSKKGTK